MRNRTAPPAVLHTPGGSTGTEVRQLMRSLPQAPKRAVLYARVSTDEQARSGYSLTQQLEALRVYAEAEGYEIVEEISDPGESGAYLERPGLDRVRDLVQNGGVDVVLAQDRDRFASEPAYLYLLQEEFARNGTKLRALNARGDDTPEGQLTEGMLDQLSKYERAKLAERTRRGRLEKARKGGIKAGRIPKYGFKVNARRDGYEVDESTMPVVRRIVSLVAEGESLHGVKRILEAEAVPTPGGAKTWNRLFIRNLVLDDAYFPHTYQEIKALVSPEVASKLDPAHSYGIVWYNRFEAKVVEKIKVGPGEYKLKRHFSERPKEQWIAVPIPSSRLERKTVERARARVSSNVRPAASGARMWELSGGLLFCGHCGRRMRGHNNQTTRNGQKHPIFYYLCPLKINESSTACESRYHRAEDLEQTVMDAVSALLSDPTDLFRQIDEKVEAEKGIARDPRRELAALGRRLDELANTRSRYLDLYAEGAITTKEELGEKLAKVDEERQSVEQAIAAANDRRDNIAKLTQQKQVILLMYAAFANFALAEFSPEHRRAMYERLGVRVTVYKDRPPEIELTLDPNALPSTDEAREALEEVKRMASAEAIEEVRRRFLQPYRETVLDEESGEWVPVEDPELELELAAQTEYEDLPHVSKDSTSRYDALSGAGRKDVLPGAPRLLEAGLRVEPCRRTGSDRVAVEAYPAIVARRFLARASYKNDERRKQTTTHRAARERLVAGLRSETLREVYGFVVEMDRSWERQFVRDPSADALDSLLCAVQAAWAYTRKDEDYGVPPECDPNEGWILDPELLANGEG